MGPDTAKEEIRERTDLVDLISQYVELRQAGRNWKGLCPFHQEKTPSFNVNREAHFWKCFGCGAGGDAFSFVQRIENLAFPEAMKFLADRVGVTWEVDPGHRQARDEREEVLSANDVAMHWFREQLAGQAGVAGRAYLESRGLDADTIERFNIGFAPAKWDGLLQHLMGRGIGEERALRAALARRSERGSVYDVFRNRIVFPITDVVGRIVGFGGRAMDPEDPAKYLNSPETLVFKKSRTFFGLDLARRMIGELGHAVVVEGYMDVVALAQYGVDHCVATLGTALTEEHAKILSRYTSEIVLVYDDDEAGIQAVLRSVRVFEGLPAAVKVAPLRDGKDPDDYIREFGTDAFRELLDDRIGLVEYRLRTIFDQYRDEGAEGRTNAAREAADVLGDIPDIARRQALVGWAADAWAGPDVARAARLEEALLREMERRARSTAPAERDSWERVLVNKGIQYGRGKPGGGRRLSRHEWLEQQRQRDQSLAAINIARWGGHAPESPLSPVSTDFISDSLSSITSPLVQSAQRRERLMLTAMLERAEVAALVLQLLRPDDMLLGSHRDIATCVADAREDEAGVPNLADAMERLSVNEELFATAIDLATAEGDYDMDAVMEDVKLIREAKLLGGENVPGFKADRKYKATPEPVEAREKDESLADIEKQVREGLADGTLTMDSELYKRYMDIRRRLHGIGELPMWDFD